MVKDQYSLHQEMVNLGKDHHAHTEKYPQLPHAGTYADTQPGHDAHGGK